jgi:hypothetical protein
VEVDEDTVGIHGDNWRWRLSIQVVELSVLWVEVRLKTDLHALMRLSRGYESLAASGQRRSEQHPYLPLRHLISNNIWTVSGKETNEWRGLCNAAIPVCSAPIEEDEEEEEGWKAKIQKSKTRHQLIHFRKFQRFHTQIHRRTIYFEG